jgi:hypothetical protein
MERIFTSTRVHGALSQKAVIFKIKIASFADEISLPMMREDGSAR